LGCGSTFLGTANSWQAGNFYAPTGATSVVGTSSATFYITGVQLEVGSYATGFDYRSYGTELALCQRYFETIGNYAGNEVVIGGYGVSGTNTYANISYKVTKRATPTIATIGTIFVSNCTLGTPTVGLNFVNIPISGNATGNQVAATGTSNYFTASAEL
jgi:hypothetical protein